MRPATSRKNAGQRRRLGDAAHAAARAEAGQIGLQIDDGQGRKLGRHHRDQAKERVIVDGRTVGRGARKAHAASAALKRQGARNRLRVGERRRVVLGNLAHELGILRIRARHRLQDAAVGEHRTGARAIVARKQRKLGRARVVDRVDARNLAGLERMVRLGRVVALVDLKQLVVALLGKRRRHVLKGRSVPGLVGDNGYRHRIDLAVGAEVRKHKHEHRGKRNGKERAPDPCARPAQQRLDRDNDGVDHGCPLVA